MDAETNHILTEIKAVVGDLSDLRYGRFAKPPGDSKGTVEEALEGLRRLEEVCQRPEDG